jgi:hypothetical protein
MINWTLTVTIDGAPTVITGSAKGRVKPPSTTTCPGRLLLPGNNNSFSPTCPPVPYDPSTQNPRYTYSFTLP